ARASAIASAICASAFKYLRLKSTVSAIHAGSVGIDRCLERRLSIAQRYHARPEGQVSTAGLARRSREGTRYRKVPRWAPCFVRSARKTPTAAVNDARDARWRSR